MVFLRFGARLAIERGTSSSVAAKPVAAGGRPVGSRLGRQDVVMFTNETKVLLVLTQDLRSYLDLVDILDQARVLAGKATAALKLPVSP